MMGWANCGADSNGRPIGYAHDATCDHPGCKAKIHRGLAYSCGPMHGEGEHDCEGYFCHEHRILMSVVDDNDPDYVHVCFACALIGVREGSLSEYAAPERAKMSAQEFAEATAESINELEASASRADTAPKAVGKVVTGGE